MTSTHTPDLEARARSLGGVFLAMVFLPLLAVLVGIRTELPDNRTATPLPSVSGMAGLDVQAFEQAQEAFRDRLPLLATAISADARLDLVLTGRSPNAEVVLGEGEWLFLSETIDRPCLDDAERTLIRELFRTLREAAAQSGVRLALLVIPDKAAVHEEHLRPDDRTRSCAKHDFATIMQDLAGPDLIDPMPRLEQLDAAGAMPYWPKDTHWTTPAASAVLGDLLTHLGMDLPAGGMDISLVDHGDGQTDDLAALLGLPTGRPSECWDTVRPGVVVTGKPVDCRWFAEAVIELRATSTGAPLLPKTVFQFDSFGLRNLDVMGPWFEQLTAMYKDHVDDAVMQAAMAEADILVVEVVQRTLTTSFVDWDLPNRLASAMRARATS